MTQTNAQRDFKQKEESSAFGVTLGSQVTKEPDLSHEGMQLPHSLVFTVCESLLCPSAHPDMLMGGPSPPTASNSSLGPQIQT